MDYIRKKWIITLFIPTVKDICGIHTLNILGRY